MDKHLIICLHGMGTYNDDWGNEDVIKTLKEAYEGYPSLLAKGSFESRFEFKFINYSQNFSDYVQRKREAINNLGNLSDAAENTLSGLGSFAHKLLKIYKATDIDDDDFWSTHVGDVFLYLVNEHIRGKIDAYIFEEVSQTMSDFINEHDGNGHLSIIAHSLGTAVITSALNRLYTDDTHYRDSFGKLKTIMTVANVANLSSIITNDNVYDSIVHPAFANYGGVCTHYINTWHDLDIFTMYKRFRPDSQEWDRFGDNPVMSGHLYIEVPIGSRDIQQKNAHDLKHYLSHPNVHLAFFRYLGEIPQYTDVVTEEERRKALIDWRKNTLWGKIKQRIKQAETAIDADIEKIKDLIEKIKNSSVQDGLEDLKSLSDQFEKLRTGADEAFDSLIDDLKKIAKDFWN